MRQPKPINERTEEDVSPRLAHCTDQRVEPGESTCPVPLAARMRAPRTKQFATHHLQVELLVRAQAIHAWPDTAQGHPLARLDVPLHFLCDKAIHLRSLQGTPTWHASTAGSATRAPTTATANGTNTPAWRSHERSPLLTDESAQRHCRCYCRCHGRGLDQRLPQLRLRARHHDRTSQGRRVVAHQPAAAETAGAWSPPASAASESAVCRHHTCTTRPQHTYATKLLSCSSHQLRKHGALRHIAVGRYGRVVPGIGDGRGEYRWCVQHTHCEWHVARTPCQQHLRCHYHRRHLWQPHSPQTLPLKPRQSEHHQRHWSRVLNHYQQAAATIEARRWLSGVAATRAWVP